LLRAADKDHVDVLSALLDRGANVEAKSKEKLYSALHYAALGDSVSALRRLLATQASRDVVDAEGNTPLHLAAAKGHKQPLELLILRGANKNAANKVGATALHLAVERAQEAVSKKLLAEGVNVNAQDHNGATPLHVAVESGGNEAIVRALLQVRHTRLWPRSSRPLSRSARELGPCAATD
jgi:ankyrin repeat protein